MQEKVSPSLRFRVASAEQRGRFSGGTTSQRYLQESLSPLASLSRSFGGAKGGDTEGGTTKKEAALLRQLLLLLMFRVYSGI